MNQVCVARAGARQWAELAVLALPTALLGLDVTVLYLLAPSLAADLKPSATEMLWMLDAYSFLIAGLLITMGTLGDRIGRRRLLLVGAVGFLLASLLAAFAPNTMSLIVARALLGVAGATLMPSTLALIRNMFADARQRALAIGVWATMFAVGMAAGPVVGAALLAQFCWGSAFLVAVPVVIVLVAAAPFVLPEYKAPQPGGLDLASVALSLAAILPIVYAVKYIAADGLDSKAMLAAVVGVACGVVFVRRQLVLPAPLLDMTLFASRAFSAALSVLLVGLTGVGGVLYLVTQYLQLVEDLSATESGLWMGPPALAMLAAAVGAPLIARTARPATVMTVALVLSLIGYGLLAFVGQGEPVTVVTAFALVYLGLGAIAALGTDVVIGAAPPNKAGSAAAMSETVQELGLAVGVALLGSLTTAIYRSRMTAGADSLSAAHAQLPAELLDHAKAAFTAGLNTAAVVAGLAVASAAVLCATMLRHIGPIAASDP